MFYVRGAHVCVHYTGTVCSYVRTASSTRPYRVAVIPCIRIGIKFSLRDMYLNFEFLNGLNVKYDVKAA